MFGRTAAFDTADPIDISIPMDFAGPQPNAYGVDPARAKALGDTRSDSSVNFEEIKFVPHCSGTHTECVGHITHERISVHECLRDALIPASLISVEPEAGNGEDRVITLRSVKEALSGRSPIALIIRTLPNGVDKLSRKYDDVDIPAYFTAEAMQYIMQTGVRHLLVDLPSIDRIYDGGKLENHRIFWRVEPGKFETNAATRMNATITELIYVPDGVADGEYILNLQIAPFSSDASPARPILFGVV